MAELDRDVALFRQSAREHDVGRSVLGHAEEEVEGQLGTVVEHHHVAGLVERRDAPARDELDVPFGECRQERGGRVG